jgi:manganese oxidase
MFTVVKVREGLARNDYKDPGWYKHPAGTVAHEWNGPAPATTRKDAETNPAQMRARKPAGGSHKH